MNLIWAGPLALLLGVSSGSACPMSEPWKEMAQTQTEGPQAALKLPAQSITIAQPFEIGLQFCGAGSERIEEVRVTAVMPAHQHGMNYRPVSQKNGPAAFVATGLFFHMPGAWRIDVTALGLSAPHFFELMVDVK